MRARASTDGASADRRSEWSPARVFLAVSAFYHLALGGAGLAVNQSFPLTSEAAASAQSGFILGIFETNGWHSLAGILIGALSLLFTIRPLHAREAALSVGFSQVFTVVALAVEDPSTFLLASNAADQVIHTATAVGGILSGWLTAPASHPPTASEAS